VQEVVDGERAHERVEIAHHLKPFKKWVSVEWDSAALICLFAN
jgi:hypothetical protein